MYRFISGIVFWLLDIWVFVFYWEKDDDYVEKKLGDLVLVCVTIIFVVRFWVSFFDLLYENVRIRFKDFLVIFGFGVIVFMIYVKMFFFIFF